MSILSDQTGYRGHLVVGSGRLSKGRHRPAVWLAVGSRAESETSQSLDGHGYVAHQVPSDDSPGTGRLLPGLQSHSFPDESSRSIPWARSARLSFKGTLQHLNTFLPLLAMAGNRQRSHFYDTLLRLVAREQVPDRPIESNPDALSEGPNAPDGCSNPAPGGNKKGPHSYALRK